MRKTRIGAFVASTALASATILGGAVVASAQQDEGPVQFSAEGNDNCQVTFTIENETNSTNYQIDYQVDGEFDGQDGVTWAERMHDAGQNDGTRWGPSSEIAEDTDEFQTGGPAYVSNLEPFTTTQTVNLRELESLPNPEADEHKIEYRLIWGPHGPHRDDAHTYKATVNGCDDSTGSVEGALGSLDVFGSAEGFIGSIDFLGSLEQSDS